MSTQFNVSGDRIEGESWLAMRERTDPKRIAVMAEEKAKARLIAAAPELLQVAIDFTKNSRGMTENERQKYAAEIIAKATGGEA